MKTLQKSLRSQCGQGLVEVTLVTPLLLLLLLGLIEIGRYAYISILVGNAARAGAGYGAQTAITAADTGGITAAANNDFKNNGQDPNALSVSSAYSYGCNIGGTISSLGSYADPCAGNKVVSLQVAAFGTFTSLFNYPGIPQRMTLSSSATMRVGECPTCPQ